MTKMKLEVGRGKYKKDVYPLLVQLAVRVRRNYAVADLEDVVSEGIVEALEEARKFDPKHKTSISTFLYRRVHGAMTDFMKEETVARERWETDDAAQDAIKNVPAENHLEEAHSNRKLFIEAMQMVETMLSDAEAAFIVRFYLEGRTDEEIGDEYGYKKREVRDIRVGGITKLRQLFAVRGRNETWVR